MKQTHLYKIDLAKIDGKGDFPCPRCGTLINPDDCTEKAYAILGTKVYNQGLEELVIRCNKCASELHLTGFSLLQTISEKDEGKPESEKTEIPLMLRHSRLKINAGQSEERAILIVLPRSSPSKKLPCAVFLGEA